MTSTGCMILIAALLLLPIALAGPALGFNGTIYLAYVVPPVLVAFVLFQLLRFGIRSNRIRPSRAERRPASRGQAPAAPRPSGASKE
jgi:hypothetical protein